MVRAAHYRSFARTAEPRIEADYDVFDLPIIDFEDILSSP